MTDAAWKLKKLAASAIIKRQFGAAIGLDIQNAFNSMPWTRIQEALVNAKVPVYLGNIIRDWVVFVQTASGMVRKEMTCGVPQSMVANITDFSIEVRNLENDLYFSRFLYKVSKFSNFLRILQFSDFFQHFLS